jgi:hypothetical protein
VKEFTMLKHILAAAVAAALITAPLTPAVAQATTEKSEKKPKKAAKKLTAQQQKMKDCSPKWAAYKMEKKVKGRAEYRKFMSTCLKG